MRRTARLAGWIALSLVLILALAACGDDEPEPDRPAASDSTPATPPPPAASAPAVANPPAPDTAATEESTPEAGDAALDLAVYAPGLHTRSGLTIVRSTEWTGDATGAFFAEVRNDTGELLRAVEGSLTVLDAEHLRLSALPLSVLLNDIPPGHSFFVGDVFDRPPGAAATAIQLDYQPADAPWLDAFYDLPVTIDSQAPAESVPYLVRGTIENTSGRDLVFWAVTLVALDAEDQIIGLSHAVVTPGTPDRVWPAGAAVPFEAPFPALAGEASSVASVVASAAGYAPLD